jgi:biopolymer transport protein TolR
MFLNKYRGRGAVKPEINMTSMVDVMSLLMVVFMATAPLLTTGMTVNLPKGSKSAITDSEKAVDIAIDKNGRIYIGKERVAEQKLKSRLLSMLKQNPSLSIIISGDAEARYGKVIEIMGDLKSSGFKKVGLKTEPKLETKKK